MKNKWYKNLPFKWKKTYCLQAMAGLYYDFYSEDELMLMFNIDNDYIENFDYDGYFERIYEYDLYCNEVDFYE